MIVLQWRYNEHDGVSNHRRFDCLLSRLFIRRSKKTSNICFTGLCEGNPPVTGGFPSQMANNAENVSIWWRNHEKNRYMVWSFSKPCKLLYSAHKETQQTKANLKKIYDLYFFQQINLYCFKIEFSRFWLYSSIQVCWHLCVCVVIVGFIRTLHCIALRWRHNDHAGVSNHQPHGCLLNRLFRRRSNKTSKLRVTGLCSGNSPGPVNSPHKGPVTRKMFPFDDVIMDIMDIISPGMILHQSYI